MACLLAAPPGVARAAPTSGAAPTPPVAPHAYLSDSATLSGPAADTASPVLILVRHAEKADDDPRDPNLTAEGRARAAALAALLADAGVTRILSSDYRRTRETARPLAERAGLDVELYDPRDLSGLAAELRQAAGVVVVVGHSNTTPELARLLGAGATPSMPESEYDRLIVLALDRDGAPRTLTLRFGAGGR